MTIARPLERSTTKLNARGVKAKGGTSGRRRQARDVDIVLLTAKGDAKNSGLPSGPAA